MGRRRPYKKYVVKVRGKTVDGGITTDWERRKRERQRERPNCTVKQVGGAVTEESAREWEKKHGYS